MPDCLQCLSSDGPLPILDLSQIVLTGTGGESRTPSVISAERFGGWPSEFPDELHCERTACSF